jgi:deazaflavin-dependent oxidoreductase (nitroreductase family)
MGITKEGNGFHVEGGVRMTNWNEKIIEEFRTNEGKVGGQFEGAPLLLLHTKGRKSGQLRVNPMMYQKVSDDTFAVFASRGGSPENPDWYYNVKADPEVSAEIGTDTVALHAREASGDERERIWETQKKRYPGFADYEKKTEGVREIPVIILEAAA